MTAWREFTERLRSAASSLLIEQQNSNRSQRRMQAEALKQQAQDGPDTAFGLSRDQLSQKEGEGSPAGIYMNTVDNLQMQRNAQWNEKY